MMSLHSTSRNGYFYWPDKANVERCITSGRFTSFVQKNVDDNLH